MHLRGTEEVYAKASGLRVMQTWDCLRCGRELRNLLGPRSLKRGDLLRVLQLLLEGMSLRGVGRITGVSKQTINKHLRRLGAAAIVYQDTHLRELPMRRLQIDEMWSFIHGRSRNVEPESRQARRNGDTWIWTSFDPDSKLVPFWLVGCRTLKVARAFVEGLRRTVNPGVEIVSDGFNAYLEAIDDGFLEANHRVAFDGFDYRHNVNTNGVERHNLTLRTSLARLRRNGNAQTRSWESLVAHLGLYTLYYNFVRTHRTVRVTPAMEAGLASSVWTLDDMVHLLDEPDAERHPESDVFESRFVHDPGGIRQRTGELSMRRAHRRDSPYRISGEWRPLVSEG